MDSEGVAGRKRIKQACEECRKGKRKCGGQKPSCDLCNKARRSCTYQSEQQSRKRKYWNEDYVHNLEDQVTLLQLMLKEAQSKENEYRSSYTDQEDPYSSPQLVQDGMPDNDHDASDGTMDKSQSTKAQRSHQAMDELSSLMLNMGIGDDREPSFTIPPSALMFSGMSADSTPQPLDHTSVLSPHLPDCIRDHSTVEGYFHSFSEYFYPFCPVIELKDHTELQMICLSKDLDVRLLGIAICAVGAYFQKTSQVNKDSTDLLEYAEQLVKIHWGSTHSESVIKACPLLAWLHTVLGNDLMAWRYITLATSSILISGIHVTTILEQKGDVPNTPISDLDKSRIRTFWIYYSIDKMVTALLGMNCTIPWRRVRVPPFASIVEDATIDQIAFDHQCRLWHLWDSSMDQLYAFEWVDMTIEEKDCLLLKAHQSLTSFYKEADPRLDLNRNDVEPSVIYFHIAYQTTLILIHRPFLNTPTKSTTLRLAVRSVTTAASSISRHIRHFQKYHNFKIAPPQVINNILSAAVIHLLNATSGQTTTLGRQSASGLRACISALEELQITWPFRVKKSILLTQELAQRWQVLWAMPIRLSNPTQTISHNRLQNDPMPGAALGGLNAHQFGQDLGAGWPAVRDFWDSLEGFQVGVGVDSLPNITGSGQGGLDWLFENAEQEY